MLYTILLFIKIIKLFIFLIILAFKYFAIINLYIYMLNQMPNIVNMYKIIITIMYSILIILSPLTLQLFLVITNFILFIYLNKIKNTIELQIYILDVLIWRISSSAYLYSKLYISIHVQKKITVTIKLITLALFLFLTVLFIQLKFLVIATIIISFATLFISRLLSIIIYLFPYKKTTLPAFSSSPQLINFLIATHPINAPIDERIFDEIINIEDQYLVYPIFFKSKIYIPNISQQAHQLHIWNIVRWNSALSKPSGFITCPSYKKNQNAIINLYIAFIPIFSESLWKEINKLNLPTIDLIAQSAFWSPFIIAKTLYKWPRNLSTYERLNEIEEEDCQCSLNRTSSLHLERRNSLIVIQYLVIVSLISVLIQFSVKILYSR